MSDILGFAFGALCGLTLGIIVMNECFKPPNNSEKPKVIHPAENAVFIGYQPKGSVNPSNPPRGGTGVPKKYPIITRPEQIPYENEKF